MSKLRFAALVLAACGAPASAHGEPLAEAIADAVQSNPILREAELGVHAAAEGRNQAFAAYLPSIDLTWRQGASEVTTVAPGGSRASEDLDPVEAAASLSQPLYTGGRRGAQTRLARADLTAAEQAFLARRQDVILVAVQAYAGVLRDTEILRLREGYVASLDQQVYATQRRLDVGDVSRTDLAQAEARAAGARAILATARAELERTRALYVEVIGAHPDALVPPTPPVLPASLDEAIANGAAANPTILAAEADERAAEARVGSELSALLPHIDLVGRVSRAEDVDLPGDEREDSSFALQMRVPLFEGGYAWSRTRQSRIERERARARTSARRRGVETEIVSAWNAVVASREVVAAAEQQVRSAEAALRGAERERGLGMRTTLDVLNAEQEWREAQVAKARADADIIVTAFTVLAAIGALGPEAFEQ